MKIIYSKETRKAERIDGAPCDVKVTHTESFIVIDIAESPAGTISMDKAPEPVEMRNARIANIPKCHGIASGKTGPMFDEEKTLRDWQYNPDGTRCLSGGTMRYHPHSAIVQKIQNIADRFKEMLIAVGGVEVNRRRSRDEWFCPDHRDLMRSDSPSEAVKKAYVRIMEAQYE